MTKEGPEITALTHRLAMCPNAFLRPPLMRSKDGSQVIGDIHTGAVISDLLIAYGGAELTPDEIESFTMREYAANLRLLQLELISAHLLYDARLREHTDQAGAVREFFLNHNLRPLAEITVDPRAYVSDPERREELARICLSQMNLLPAGEKLAAARDRLATLDSVERERVIVFSRNAQKRAQELREALARKAAEEAASKMSRE